MLTTSGGGGKGQMNASTGSSMFNNAKRVSMGGTSFNNDDLIDEGAVDGSGENTIEEKGPAVTQQPNQQISKPLVFGLTEDIRYGHHKGQVRFFLENYNNQ